MIYYNEFDPKAAAWLRELIKQGHLPKGWVDDRSIVDVKPKDLEGFTQCHFFAGIGGWPLALQLAGWDPARPVWTGSCPCQPFSQANSRKRENDERHLWPVFASLISQRSPPVVLGEQVASPAGLAWFDTVRTDLENEGYAVGGADLCAAGVGAPHIRQRLYWVAVSCSERRERERLLLREGRSQQAVPEAGRSGEAGGVGNARGTGSRWDTGAVLGAEASAKRLLRGIAHESIAAGVDRSIMGNANGAGSQGRRKQGNRSNKLSPWQAGVAYVDCTDGKVRPVEPGTFPLVARLPSRVVPSGDPSESYSRETDEARVMRLKGYGNAIVPQVAAEFIKAVMS